MRQKKKQYSIFLENLDIFSHKCIPGVSIIQSDVIAQGGHLVCQACLLGL